MKIVDVKVGHEIPKERWLEAAHNMKILAQAIGNQLRVINRDGMGQQDYNDIMEDAALAIIALEYVANFATDKCRIIPIGGER